VARADGRPTPAARDVGSAIGRAGSDGPRPRRCAEYPPRVVFLPIGDEPNVRHRPPWANYALILANVVVFLGALAAGREGGRGYDALVERYAYVPAAPTFETLFTSMFMHGGFGHLLGNMLYLWIFGDNVETKLGSVGYLAAYFASGVVATALFGVVNPNSAVPLVGASGAISGVQGIYFLLFPRNRVRLLIWFYYVTVVHVKARWIIAFWFVLNDVVPVVLGRSVLGDNVAHAAHLGGFASGLAVAFAVLPSVRNWFPEEPEGRYGRREPSTLRSSPAWGKGIVGRASTTKPTGDGAADEIVAAWRAGRRGDAADAFASALRHGRPVELPEPEHVRLAVHLYDGARFEDARLAFASFLERHPTSPNAPAASFGLGMILSRRDGDFDAAVPLLEEAARRHPDPHVREVADREVARIAALG
jgi:membrane associated rhomboid family serine protease